MPPFAAGSAVVHVPHKEDLPTCRITTLSLGITRDSLYPDGGKPVQVEYDTHTEAQARCPGLGSEAGCLVRLRSKSLAVAFEIAKVTLAY